MLELLRLPRIPIGDWVDTFVRDVLLGPFNWIFELIRSLGEDVVALTARLLGWPPPVLFILLAALLAWRVRSAVFAVFTILAFLLVDNMELWSAMIDTLALVLVATVVAIIVGVPVGILAARSGKASAVVRPVLDFMQTLPAFVYLIPAIMLFSIGPVPGLFATLVFAIPPGVRFTELGIRQVDHSVIEAAQAFGSSPNQTLVRVQLPLALATIMGGINQVIMLALSMVVIAGMVGAGGLGELIFRAITRINIALGAEAGLAVVILAIFLDRLTATLGDRAGRQGA